MVCTPWGPISEQVGPEIEDLHAWLNSGEIQDYITMEDLKKHKTFSSRIICLRDASNIEWQYRLALDDD